MIIFKSYFAQSLTKDRVLPVTITIWHGKPKVPGFDSQLDYMFFTQIACSIIIVTGSNLLPCWRLSGNRLLS